MLRAFCMVLLAWCAAHATADDPAAPPESPPFEAHGWGFDLSAFQGFPAEWRQAVQQRLTDALSRVTIPQPALPVFEIMNTESSRGGAPFYAEYPHAVRYRPRGEEPVPVVVLPAIADLRAELAGPQAATSDDINDCLRLREFSVGRTLFYRVGERSRPVFISLPVPWGTEFNGSVMSNQTDWRAATKFVHRPFAPMDPSTYASEKLRIGEPGWATELGKLVAIPFPHDNPRVRLVQLQEPGGATRTWLAFLMCDANGGKRGLLLSPEGVSGFDRPLDAPHSPQVAGHSLLRIPRPLPATVRTKGQEEELTLDEWYGEQPSKVWVLRTTADSTPFLESFVLAPANERRELKPYAVFIFADANVEEIAAALNSLGTTRE